MVRQAEALAAEITLRERERAMGRWLVFAAPVPIESSLCALGV